LLSFYNQLVPFLVLGQKRKTTFVGTFDLKPEKVIIGYKTITTTIWEKSASFFQFPLLVRELKPIEVLVGYKSPPPPTPVSNRLN
jgi:hypothetical protein